MWNLDIVAEAIKEKINPATGKSTLSQRKLAELVMHKYPGMFQSFEAARTTVRRAVARNAAGRCKKRLEWNGFELPEPEKNDYRKYIVNAERIAIMSDIHFPYYDKLALNAAMRYIIDFEPTCIILNGDIIDCYPLSDYVRDIRARSFKYELDIVRNFTQQLRTLFPEAQIVYKIGNHEERYERVILKRVPEFLEIDAFSIERVLNLKDLGIEVVTNKRIIKCGKVNVLHAHELSKGLTTPVNPARGLFISTKANTIGGHYHQTSEHMEKDLNDSIVGCWSVGHLSDPHPAYMPVNKWNHGFLVMENRGDDFSVHNMKIIDGKVL